MLFNSRTGHFLHCIIACSLFGSIVACGGGTPSTPPIPGVGSPSLEPQGGSAKTKLTVSPTGFTLSTAAGAQNFTAAVPFAGTITASSSSVGIASVNPSTATATEGLNDTHYSATFAIVPVSQGDATITVRDKQGDSATVSVTVTANPPSGGIVSAAETIPAPAVPTALPMPALGGTGGTVTFARLIVPPGTPLHLVTVSMPLPDPASSSSVSAQTVRSKKLSGPAQMVFSQRTTTSETRSPQASSYDYTTYYTVNPSFCLPDIHGVGPSPEPYGLGPTAFREEAYCGYIDPSEGISMDLNTGYSVTFPQRATICGSAPFYIGFKSANSLISFDMTHPVTNPCTTNVTYNSATVSAAGSGSYFVAIVGTQNPPADSEPGGGIVAIYQQNHYWSYAGSPNIFYPVFFVCPLINNDYFSESATGTWTFNPTDTSVGQFIPSSGAESYYSPPNDTYHLGDGFMAKSGTTIGITSVTATNTATGCPYGGTPNPSSAASPIAIQSLW